MCSYWSPSLLAPMWRGTGWPPESAVSWRISEILTKCLWHPLQKSPRCLLGSQPALQLLGAETTCPVTAEPSVSSCWGIWLMGDGWMDEEDNHPLLGPVWTSASPWWKWQRHSLECLAFPHVCDQNVTVGLTERELCGPELLLKIWNCPGSVHIHPEESKISGWRRERITQILNNH